MQVIDDWQRRNTDDRSLLTSACHKLLRKAESPISNQIHPSPKELGHLTGNECRQQYKIEAVLRDLDSEP